MGLMGNVAKFAANKAVDAVIVADSLSRSQSAAVKDLLHPNKLTVSKKGMFSTRELEVFGKGDDVLYSVTLREKEATRASVYDSSDELLVEVRREKYHTSGFLGLPMASTRYVLEDESGRFGGGVLGHAIPDYSQPTKTRIDFDFNGWQVRASLMSSTFEVYNQKGDLVAQIIRASEKSKPYAIGYANPEDELGVVICLAVLDLHMRVDEEFD